MIAWLIVIAVAPAALVIHVRAARRCIDALCAGLDADRNRECEW